jgi:hypothetical protein
MPPTPPRRRLAIVLAVLATAAPIVPATVGAAEPSATTPPPDASGIDFTAYRSGGLPIVPGQPFYLNVRTSVPLGPAHFAEVVGDTLTELGPGSPWVDGGPLNGVPTRMSHLLLSTGASRGDHTYRAIFDATDTLPEVTKDLVVSVERVPTSVSIWQDVNPLQANRAANLYADVSSAGSGLPVGGSVEWRDADTDTVLKTAQMPYTSIPVLWPTAGVHHYVAKYLGDEVHAPSSSPVYTLTVVPDAVEAVQISVDLTTFYPVVDGYKDTVHARGNRIEPISVRVVIYNSSNKIVRGFRVPLGTGGYTVTWNGKSTAGTLQPSGKYKIVQVLTDNAGTTLAVTKFVTLSRKRLYWYTTYINKTTAQATKKTSSWIGWQFALPAAAAYKGMSFQVYGRSVNIPGVHIGGWDFRVCGYSAAWSPGCVSGWSTLSFEGNAWGVRGLHTVYHRYGRTVRGIAEAEGSGYVYKARLKVSYGILK